MTKSFINQNQNGTFYFKDQQKLVPHNEKGPAFQWIDGSNQFYFNGVEMTKIKWEQKIQKFKKYTKQYKNNKK